MLGAGAIGLTVAYGMARLMNVGFQQLRDAVFARVAQRALRALALADVPAHSRDVDALSHYAQDRRAQPDHRARGQRGRFPAAIPAVLDWPLVLELLLIGIVLWTLFDIWYLVVVAAVIGAYTAFTFKVTEWRVRLRREMNDQDTDANQKAIDSLLNYETVKYFGAEHREASAMTRRWRATSGPRCRPRIRWPF